MFQHTAARRGLQIENGAKNLSTFVSTHSRPKAAATAYDIAVSCDAMFQHTAARRRLDCVLKDCGH